MSAAFGGARFERDGIRITTLHFAVVISLALHALMLLGWLPQLMNRLANPADDMREGKKAGSLAVRIAPPPTPPRMAAEPVPAPPRVKRVEIAPVPKATAKAPKAAPPPIIASERPTPNAPRVAPPPPAPAKEAAKPAALGTDFAAFVEARRRARDGGGAPRPADPRPQETEQERHSREVAANLGLDRVPSFGTNKNTGGGVFQVLRFTASEATVAYFGYNKAIRRNSMQNIEIQRGEHPSMELAVVRRMIQLIRDQTGGDFTWESQRLGRDVELSARLADNAELEGFLMSEFFSLGMRR
jgi:outer membrane biosynthesis protein TonB